MKVQIENQLYLESDGTQFIIKEYTGKRDKFDNELYKTHGYFPTVASALKRLVKMKVMKSTAQTLSELVEDIRRIEKYIEDKVNA